MRSWYRSELRSLVLGLSLALLVNVTPRAQTSTTKALSQTTPANQVSSPAGAPQDQARGRVTSLYDELKLTLEQKERIAAVMDEQDQQLGAVSDDASLSPEQKQQKVAQIHEVGSTKIRAILTPEQLRKLATSQETVSQQQHDDRNEPKEPRH